MINLLLKNLFFTLLQPGSVVGLIPYFFLEGKIAAAFTERIRFIQFLGAGILLMGTFILLNCVLRFPYEANGTISPFVRSKKLLTTGLYNYSRNPMYIGVIMILVGESIFFKSGALWMYSFFVFIGFHLYLVLFEELRLRKDFGKEYDAYYKKVRRWI